MMTAAAIETLWRAGKRAEAIEAARAVAGEADDATENTRLLDIADVLQTMAEETGRSRDADAAVEVATLLRRRAWLQDDPQSVHASQGLVMWYARTGRYQEAEAELARSRAMAERFVSQSQAPLRTLLSLSADVAGQAGRLEDAIAFLQRAIEVEQTPASRGADELGPLYRALAQALLRADRVDEAAAALDSSLRAPRRRLSGSEEAEVLSQLAHLRERQGQVHVALPLMERAVERCQAELGPNHPHTARHRQNLARLRALDPQGDAS